MVAILGLPATFVADLFKSRHRLEAEILYLRTQLNIALKDRIRDKLQLRYLFYGCPDEIPLNGAAKNRFIKKCGKHLIVRTMW